MEETQLSRSLDAFQSISIQSPAGKKKRKRGLLKRGFLFSLFLILLYFIAPLRTNILLLGTDDSPERGTLGRTDTIILTTIIPLKPYVGMLSIPRDLWVTIPNVGEQRINTAYFFAEANEPGTGGDAAGQTIRENFGIPARYYAVIHMTGLVDAVDALGGVEIQLDAASGGYPAGIHQLSGVEALAFARDRAGSSDFSRMQRTQILVTALLDKGLTPSSWPKMSKFITSLAKSVETNIPLWQWPRMAFVVVRIPLFGIDSRAITPEMVTPFQTSGGAQVLGPNWEAINPLLDEMFGK
ncbi:MAG: LCP family protein [Chloroflexi bacterium]|nr:LCP family protein [Chloroflexota bacterium]